MAETLTLTDLHALAIIRDLAVRTARVSWLGTRGDVQSGTVRCIGDERGNFLRGDEEVRDAFVRITTAAGFEWFAPIREIMSKVNAGEFVEG